MWELNESSRTSYYLISPLYIICLHVTASVTDNIVHIYHCLFPRNALLKGSTLSRFTKNFAFVTNCYNDEYRTMTDLIRCVFMLFMCYFGHLLEHLSSNLPNS